MYSDIHDRVCEQYNVIEFIPGHIKSLGRHAGIMKNPLWRVKVDEKEYIIMYCEPEVLVKLCPLALNKIIDYELTNNIHLTWYISPNGYVACHSNDTCYYMHQIIMNHYGHGRGTSNISIDHIDRDPRNNSMENLRLATRKEQEQNSKGIMPNTKRERQTIARPLPEGITQDMLRKYVVYYYNVYNKEQNKSREYFRVEGHPKHKKSWETTKSGKVTILEKLAMANQKVIEFDTL
jgi:hypothetical protein